MHSARHWPATVRATRAVSESELTDLLLARVNRMLAHGSTTIEVKSGYGLDTETELKMLRAILAWSSAKKSRSPGDDGRSVDLLRNSVNVELRCSRTCGLHANNTVNRIQFQQSSTCFRDIEVSHCRGLPCGVHDNVPSHVPPPSLSPNSRATPRRNARRPSPPTAPPE